MSKPSKTAGKREPLVGSLKAARPARAFFSGKLDTPVTMKVADKNGSVEAGGRASLLERAKAARDAITDEEDAAITAAARTDPDNQPLSRRGRPRLESPKVAILLRLDPDVVESFKSGGSGWQTRMNDVLRRSAGLK